MCDSAAINWKTYQFRVVINFDRSVWISILTQSSSFSLLLRSKPRNAVIALECHIKKQPVILNHVDIDYDAKSSAFHLRLECLQRCWNFNSIEWRFHYNFDEFFTPNNIIDGTFFAIEQFRLNSLCDGILIDWKHIDSSKAMTWSLISFWNFQWPNHFPRECRRF